MKRFILRLGILVLTFLIGTGIFYAWEQLSPWKSSRQSNELSLVFMTSSTAVRAYDSATAKIFVTNYSNANVTLVQPGDGSWSGWRTPSVAWSIMEITDSGEEAPTPRARLIGCGNVAPLRLRWSEVFQLAPGESKELKVSGPYFSKPGIYKVKFLYANQPSTEWLGRASVLQNPLAMWRAKHSTETRLISNEITFTVTE
jgi:hypothetical protein